MVYFYTSTNVKMFRNILLDYESTQEQTPQEFMKSYIEKSPESVDDPKLSWIAETFLSIQKHAPFLNKIESHMSEQLSEEDQDYLVIIFHAITFQITPKDRELIYKCLFNLSKHLLYTFTKFLGNNEVLSFISQVAQTDYDANYITVKIVDPLFIWQPYISEMAHNYAEYVKKVQSKRIKPPTIPVQPNVLNRKHKVVPLFQTRINTPPNSMRHKGKRMLTKDQIDQRLKISFDLNKQKATHLLNDVKTKEIPKTKFEKSFKKYCNTKDEVDSPVYIKPTILPLKSPLQPVKDNAATLKRINRIIQKTEEEELKWFENLMINCCNSTKVEELEEHNRQELERQRLLDIERNHLMGQISHEEALIAKKRLIEDNRKKYEEFLKEREIWNQQIEMWRKRETEKNHKSIERLSMMELNVINAKNEVLLKKKEMAEKYKKETEILRAKAMKQKQEELERRVNMIKEIRILSIIAKKSKTPKIIDLTETSGLGFLCEMSMAELQERLSLMKIALKDELENKKKQIKEDNDAAKRDLEETKNSINQYMNERQILKKVKRKTSCKISQKQSIEINNLKKVLEEKRKIRVQMDT